MIKINFTKDMMGKYYVIIKHHEHMQYMGIDRKGLEQIRDMAQKLLLDLNKELDNVEG